MLIEIRLKISFLSHLEIWRFLKYAGELNMFKFYFFENEPLHERTFVEMRQYIVNVEMQPKNVIQNKQIIRYFIMSLLNVYIISYR